MKPLPPKQRPIALELCIQSLADARRCAEVGVARVELNSAIDLGGLTPSIGLTELVVDALEPSGCRVIAMARPRPGGFAYDDSELEVMARDIGRLLAAGVDGVALGVLNPSGTVALEQTRSLIKPVLDAQREAVFHRAFDLTPDPFAALDTLVELGFTRVLTSGQAATAIDGSGLIRRLIEHAHGRIDILLGSGVRPDNVTELVKATGCDQVHASLRSSVTDATGALNPEVRFNAPGTEEDAYAQADAHKIHAMMDVLRDTCSR